MQGERFEVRVPVPARMRGVEVRERGHGEGWLGNAAMVVVSAIERGASINGHFQFCRTAS